ncbi:hypothetical protein [Virgibacillus sp. SK37]|uniref:hypothetical protein n=1 Tax=Virgibacillus sp. SK37 TaxID=403957 RepID=UPI0004D12EF9|nr:hypothetical protein [Virgibacillus sp. SK37]AIF45133.1 hypothetical protein X953_01830 [Virgibacillus sp. SK37]
MNETVEKTQDEYRDFRESISYCIFDIESKLVQLAEEGRIWMIQGMKDLTESELILINHYLSDKRELQIYDFV